MQQIFVNCLGDDFVHEYQRTRAKGYKTLRFDDNVEHFSCVEVTGEGDAIIVKEAEYSKEEEDHYLILCREFGLIGFRERFMVDFNVLYLDGGVMLITLNKNGIIIKIDDALQMPLVGTDTHPAVSEEDIEWFDAERLLSFTTKMMNPTVKMFTYDFEYSYTMRGSNGSVEFIPHPDENVDLSLGYVAAFEQSEQYKKDLEDANKIKDMLDLGSDKGSGSVVWMDDGEDDEDDDEDDEYDDDDDF